MHHEYVTFISIEKQTIHSYKKQFDVFVTLTQLMDKKEKTGI